VEGKRVEAGGGAGHTLAYAPKGVDLPEDWRVGEFAMHIAALKPVAVNRSEVSSELIERERTIAAARAAESGKPANIVEKMVEGSIAKFRKENALLSQLFVIDNKTPVADVVAAAAQAAGAPIALKAFKRFQLGEGIEKKESDFAAEVAAAAGTSKAEPVAFVELRYGEGWKPVGP